MITNLVTQLIITLVTNVVQTDNAQWKDLGHIGTFQMTPDYSQATWGAQMVAPATERYTTTNVVERATLTWELWGEKRTQTVERPVWSATVTERKFENWVPVNSPLVITNFTLTTTNIILNTWPH